MSLKLALRVGGRGRRDPQRHLNFSPSFLAEPSGAVKRRAIPAALAG
jgi:hypothetical protein